MARAAAALTLELEDDDLMEPGLAAVRAAGEPARLQLALQVAGVHWGSAGEPERAVHYAAQTLELSRRAGNAGKLAIDLLLMVQALVQAGRLDEAERHMREAEPLMPHNGDGRLSFGLFRGDLAIAQGDWALAAHGIAEHAVIAARHSTSQLVIDLRLIALSLARLGAHEAAIELEAAASRIGAATGELGGNPWAGDLDAALRTAREQVGAERAAAAARRGRGLSARMAADRAPELVRALVT
jgi:tetratricopeptide (TPR) repeat protein